MTQLFRCSCCTAIETGVVFQFVHIEDNNKRGNVYMFQVYTEPEKEQLVRNHYTVIGSATERSVGEATAEAAQTIATILVADISPNPPPPLQQQHQVVKIILIDHRFHFRDRHQIILIYVSRHRRLSQECHPLTPVLPWLDFLSFLYPNTNLLIQKMSRLLKIWFM
jgi:hypothetical protein